MATAFIDIDYDEGVSGTYRAVVLLKGGETVRFATSNPGADLASAREQAGGLFLEGSSLTHFAMDDDGWRFDEDDDLVPVRRKK